ncbi:MAG: exosortase N [Pseudobacter sp.]|uniref:exosortase N n=1 Tax=Pseudobacter sp. TaxID=2045420 RepID=UPI003F7E14E6
MEKKMELSYPQRMLAAAAQLPIWVWVAFAGYAGVMFFSLHDYIGWQSANVVLGLLALPLVTRITGKNGLNYRYGILAMGAAVLSCYVPANTLLYFSIVFALLFVTEAGIGRINLLPLILAVLMSPLVQYAADVFSFPIRLHLTQMVGQGMELMGMEVTVRGNMILYQNNEFAVDPACMGLNMLVTSLITGVMMMAVNQQRYKKIISARWIIPVMICMVALNIFSNSVRMVCLVLFNILPDHPAHGWIGIACLFLYVMLPAMWLSGWLIKRFGTDLSKMPPVQVSARLTGWGMLAVQALLLVSVSVAATLIKKEKAALHNDQSPVPAVAGFQSTRIDASIVKLQDSSTLVYIKQIPGFYSGDHHPMICWRGSGFSFRQIEQQQVAGTTLYTALLTDGKQQLHTAWWYDNGSSRTVNQFVWRWDAFKGHLPYSLINITASSESELKQAVTKVLNQQPFNSILKGM